MGTDVKVMAFANDRQIDITACVPQIAQFVRDKEQYVENMSRLHQLCHHFVKEYFPEATVSFTFNARDKIESNELYLTAIGSSIESGDEGVVGRGNRVNGLITPMRPMNVEGANGKNPVYHVGKLYNVLAKKMASELCQKYHQAVVVNLISRTGGNLLEPWKIVIQLEKEDVPLEELAKDVESLLPTIPHLTEEIIHGLIKLS
jgi:S-adenosylmethionine synthetase